MKRVSNASFRARLGRAEDFYTTISGFPDYKPVEKEFTVPAFRLLLDDIIAIQSKHTTAQHDFSEAVKVRSAVYSGTQDSLNRIATLVKAYIKAKYKKTSQEYASIDRIILNIRGEKPIRITKNSNEETISRSDKSYTAQQESLRDMVTLITGFAEYKPANAKLTLAQLQVLNARAFEANTIARQKYAAFKPKVAQRQDNFTSLAERTLSIKDMVKSQYGTDSPEFRLIKGFSFTKS